MKKNMYFVNLKPKLGQKIKELKTLRIQKQHLLIKSDNSHVWHTIFHN